MSEPVTAKRGEYKGHPMLTLSSGINDKYPFSFGLSKARRILACIETIKQFVDEETAREALKKSNSETKVNVK